MFLALLLACRAASPPPQALDETVARAEGEAIAILRGEHVPAHARGDSVDLYAVDGEIGSIVVYGARVTEAGPGMLAVAITEEEAGFLESAQARPGVWISAGRWPGAPVYDRPRLDPRREIPGGSKPAW